MDIKCDKCKTGSMVDNYGDVYCINCGWRKGKRQQAQHLFTINYKYNYQF